MLIKIELTEEDLKQLVSDEITRRMPDGRFVDPSTVKILVKTTKNWSAEWEVGKFRATLEVHT